MAYCAPGQTSFTETLLALEGEQVARIVEHPWMTGIDDVFVVAEPPSLVLDPDAFRIGPSLLPVQIASRSQ